MRAAKGGFLAKRGRKLPLVQRCVAGLRLEVFQCVLGVRNCCCVELARFVHEGEQEGDVRMGWRSVQFEVHHVVLAA